MLVRNPEDGKLYKTEDDSWPRCSCGRSVLEDMEFPIYYGTGPDDPILVQYASGFMEKRPETDYTLEEKIEQCLSMGVGLVGNECLKCGDAYSFKQGKWISKGGGNMTKFEWMDDTSNGNCIARIGDDIWLDITQYGAEDTWHSKVGIGDLILADTKLRPMEEARKRAEELFGMLKGLS